MIAFSQTSKRRSKIQQQISTGDLPEKKNLTQSAFSINRKAYQNPIRKETSLVQTSQAAVISAATPFSIPIRYSSFNLNANNQLLKFTPRSGSLPRIVGEEPGDYGDREALRFHKRTEETEKEEEELAEKEEPQGVQLQMVKKKNEKIFSNEEPSNSVPGLTMGAETSARLADLAYKGSSERDLSFFTEKGYTVDDDFSNEEHIVIVNPDNQEVAIGIRGTAFNLNNILTDATIALGNFEQSERARRTLQLRDQLRERYPNFQFLYAGHSMGGTAAAYAAQDDPNANATTFNAGSTPFGGAIETAENVSNYRTEGDAISQGIGNAITIPKQCASSLAHSSSQFVPGAPCEKPGFFSFVKNTLEAAGNVAAKGIKTFSPLIPAELGVPLKAVAKVNAKLLGEAERQNRGLLEAPPVTEKDIPKNIQRRIIAGRKSKTLTPQERRKQSQQEARKSRVTQRRLGGGQMEGIDYAQPMQIEAPTPEPQQITGPTSTQMDTPFTNIERNAYRNFTKFAKKQNPNQPVPSIEDFVNYKRSLGRQASSKMDWEQTYEDLVTGLSSNVVPISREEFAAARSQRRITSQRTPKTLKTSQAFTPLLEYSAGGEPASTSQSSIVTKTPKLTADREITLQTDRVQEGKTRSQQKAVPSLSAMYKVGYWKGKTQPKKPKKKRNESEEEFKNRQSDYQQFILLWKEANPPRRSTRKRS